MSWLERTKQHSERLAAERPPNSERLEAERPYLERLAAEREEAEKRRIARYREEALNANHKRAARILKMKPAELKEAIAKGTVKLDADGLISEEQLCAWILLR